MNITPEQLQFIISLALPDYVGSSIIATTDEQFAIWDGFTLKTYKRLYANGLIDINGVNDTENDLTENDLIRLALSRANYEEKTAIMAMVLGAKDKI